MQSNLLDVVVDFETYYDSEYSLTHLTVPEYVLDPRFEVIGVSIGLPGQKPKWYSGNHVYIRKVLSTIPWERVRMIAHNAMFDGSIIEWIFDLHPAKYLCTMMGSRPYVAPYIGSMSLAKVAAHLDIGVKGDAVHEARGLHRLDFNPYQLAAYGRYCCDDSTLSRKIAEKLLDWMPQVEQDLLDLTIKKFTRPRLCLDETVIKTRQADLATKFDFISAKAGLIGADLATLRSRPKFAAKLRSFGVEPGMKKSKRTGKQTFAFGKDDTAMAELLIHSDERIRTLAEAKIFTSSTMEGKRLERFKLLYDLDVGGRHLLPVPLLYYGAHTGRLSGYDKINLQNLTRVKRDKATGDIRGGHLRFALRAPEGYSIVAADLSNIEVRITAALANCTHLVDAFAQGRDIYCEFATKIYGRLITKADEIERFVGKTCILGLGYGMGWERFGLAMQTARIKMSDEMLRHIVYLYRDTYPAIPELWSTLEGLAHKIIDSKCLGTWGPLQLLHERFVLPNGMPLIYPNIRIDRAERRLVFDLFRGKARAPSPMGIWGGTFTENVVQALAKIIISTAEVRLARVNLPAVLQVHDELVYCVPTYAVPVVTKAIRIALCAPVPWLPSLPVACEIKSGPSYGDAK